MLSREQFPAFFHAAQRASGYEGPHLHPYPWQERVLDHLLEHGEWPERLVAPTGSGKTSVIDVHVFAQALTALDPIRPPRRLSMVVDRRVLVDDQYEYAVRLAARLIGAGDGILARVAEALLGLRAGNHTQAREIAKESEPLVVARLRGGAVPDRVWLDDPTAAAIICATPDMWGSRLLFRGYGSSPRAWPREAGLLAVDSVVVVDEAHLARQLVTTARRVRQLVSVHACQELAPLPALQVIETTATPTADVAAPALIELGVNEHDLSIAPLARRLRTPKALRVLEVDGWVGINPAAKVAGAIAEEVVAMLDRSAAYAVGASGSVGCFLNSVRRAVAVATTLAQRAVDGRSLRVALICGQVRPADLETLKASHPNLLTVIGDPEIDVIVSTQSLEVGVDLDLVGIVTDLASGSALAQRAGRVNRRGLRGRGEIAVVAPIGALKRAPEYVIGEKDRSGPYEADELRDALGWISGLPTLDDGSRDVCPWVLTQRPPPSGKSRRGGFYQRPELADAWLWSRTSDLLANEIDLRLWLAEDFEADLSTGLVVRDQMPTESADAIQLVRDLYPRDHEVYALPLIRLSQVLADLYHRTRTRTPTGDQSPAPATVVWRAGDVVELEWSEPVREGDSPRPRIRPGDIVVLDSAAAAFSPRQKDSVSPQVPVTADDVGKGTTPATTHDVLAQVPSLTLERRSSTHVARLEPPNPDTWVTPAWASLADAVAEADDDPRRLNREVCEWLSRSPGRKVLTIPDALRHDMKRRRVDIIAHRRTDGELVRVIVRSNTRAVRDEERRQEWAPTDTPVTLTKHQQAVGERVKVVAAGLGLPHALLRALQVAGEHHDDGKSDPRFQTRLDAPEDGPLLAKSSQARRWQGRAGRAPDLSGLPTDWRHEQLSVALAWPILREGVGGSDDIDIELTARLIGTTHGRGRPGFPHVSSDLILTEDAPTVEAAEVLFDEGEWDALIERTQLAYGPWFCAYLEALLRAADGQVSMEGS